MENFSELLLGDPEERAVADLREAHRVELGKQLRGMVIFGGSDSASHNIDLLEIIENWEGPRQILFDNAAEYDLRGLLRLNILTPGEFEDPSSIYDGNRKRWALGLLNFVRQKYRVVSDYPFGYATSVLESSSPVGFLDESEQPVIGRDPRELLLLTKKAS